MAGLEKKVKKAFIRYTKKHYPQEADSIIQRADELFPELYSKAPFIGGKENLMAYNLDMMIIAASFYEASDHRIDGESFLELGKEILNKYAFVRKFVNLNRKWQMILFRNSMYKRYVPYAKLVDEKLSIDFYQCHRSFIVNLNYVTKYSSHMVILHNDVEIPVSSKYRTELTNRMIDHFKKAY